MGNFLNRMFKIPKYITYTKEEYDYVVKYAYDHPEFGIDTSVIIATDAPIPEDFGSPRIGFIFSRDVGGAYLYAKCNDGKPMINATNQTKIRWLIFFCRY